MSAAAGNGIQVVLDRLLAGVDPAVEKRKPKKVIAIDGAPRRIKSGYIVGLEDGTWDVRWVTAQRLVSLSDLGDPRIVGQLFREFMRLGVLAAMEAKGVKYGDTVKIGDWVFTWGDMLGPEEE